MEKEEGEGNETKHRRQVYIVKMFYIVLFLFILGS